MSDKANCQVCGFVSDQSYRYWSDADPRRLRERRLHSEPVVVWCIMCVCVYPALPGKSGLIYLWTLIITPDVWESQLSIKNDPEPMYFQQDGATTYTDRLSIDFVRESFPHRFISRLDEHIRRPVGSSWFFFRMGIFLKERVYCNTSKTWL